MHFSKMTGAGNDFIVLAHTESAALRDETGAVRTGVVRRLCDRRYGAGADGLMIVGVPDSGSSGDVSFSVEFFNSDGSAGMLCGNGARCALEFAALTGAISRTEGIRFLFAGRSYCGTSLSRGEARLELSDDYSLEAVSLSSPFPHPLACHRVDVGSLHCVVDIGALRAAGLPEEFSGFPGGEAIPAADQPHQVQAAHEAEPRELAHQAQTAHEADHAGPTHSAQDNAAVDLAGLDLASLGPILRHHPRFAPAGVNVNVCCLEDGFLHIRTFERGVEAETLACGTGSVSSALVYWSLGRISPPVRLLTRSGEVLIVDFVPNADRASNISLSGPARLVFVGDIDPHSL